jgi:peptidoglycan pentaglycine glycine transferase (the first glycine)
MSLLQASEWDDYLSSFPDAHLLQTSLWGNLKSAFGWQVIRLVVDYPPDSHAFTKLNAAGAQVLFRRFPFGFTTAYIPKGPVGSNPALWSELDRICQKRNVIFLKVEPDQWLSSPQTNLAGDVPAGFLLSSHSIQPPRTLLVDLEAQEQQILGRMKQKTRYNIRLAVKKGVVVRPADDVDAFYVLMKDTAVRDGFGIHSQEYYRRTYDLFHSIGECELLVADYEKEMLAGLMVFAHGSRAWYFYGASSNRHRERMPAYLLQWEAMRWARNKGCTVYDLWGVPDASPESLEDQFGSRSTGLWGVYRFKRGFGGRLCRASGPWDRVYHPIMYAFYRWWVNRRVNAGAERNA